VLLTRGSAGTYSPGVPIGWYQSKNSSLPEPKTTPASSSSVRTTRVSQVWLQR
jgi:hypothetical protein